MDDFNKVVPNLQVKLDGVNDEQRTFLNGLLSELNWCFDSDTQLFFKRCYIIYKIKNWFKDNSYCFDKKRNVVKFWKLMKEYGLSESGVSRYVCCIVKYAEFITDESGKLTGYTPIKEFLDFSKSKLIILLPVDIDTLKKDILNKVLRPDMSSRSIREYVKNYFNMLKGEQEECEDPVEETDETLPEKYDINKVYTIEEFEKFTKDQLIQIAFELQEKLKK